MHDQRSDSGTHEVQNVGPPCSAAIRGVDHALSSCLVDTDMSATTSLLPAQLLSELKSVILRVFEAIDDGSSRCVVARVSGAAVRSRLSEVAPSNVALITRITKSCARSPA